MTNQTPYRIKTISEFHRLMGLELRLIERNENSSKEPSKCKLARANLWKPRRFLKPSWF